MNLNNNPDQNVDVFIKRLLNYIKQYPNVKLSYGYHQSGFKQYYCYPMVVYTNCPEPPYVFLDLDMNKILKLKGLMNTYSIMLKHKDDYPDFLRTAIQENRKYARYPITTCLYYPRSISRIRYG